MQRIIGIALDQLAVCQYIVTELCPKGTLNYVIENQSIQLDWLFKNALIRDLVNVSSNEFTSLSEQIRIWFVIGDDVPALIADSFAWQSNRY